MSGVNCRQNPIFDAGTLAQSNRGTIEHQFGPAQNASLPTLRHIERRATRMRPTATRNLSAGSGAEKLTWANDITPPSRRSSTTLSNDITRPQPAAFAVILPHGLQVTTSSAAGPSARIAPPQAAFAGYDYLTRITPRWTTNLLKKRRGMKPRTR